MRVGAKFISILFHPLLLATYLVLVLGHFFPAMLMIAPNHLWLIASIVFGFTFVIPSLNLLMFRYWGSLQSLKMESRQGRVLPFVFISSLYVLVAFLFFYKLPFSINFSKIMVIVSLLVIASTIITFFLKVSVHSLAMWGMVGILLPLVKFSPALLWPTAVVIAASGLVISSRLLLDAHTPRETILGSITGLLVGYGGMMVLF